MRLALEEARAGARSGEVPVGAVIVYDGELIARAHNAPIGANDPTAHAEMLVLREAGQVVGAPRLPRATLYVTLEPCLMCLGAMIHARVERLVFGAADPKLGATGHIESLPLGPEGLNHRLQIVRGVLAEEAGALLTEFFQARR